MSYQAVYAGYDTVGATAQVGGATVTASTVLAWVPSKVYVALGDSYSSGQGAPPFEGGTLAEPGPQVVPQEDTYTYGPPGVFNSCHRSFVNYARVASAQIDPTMPVVDVTCSGAFENGGTAPYNSIADGPVGTPTQLQLAAGFLASDYATSPGKVSIASVTMGGNDIGFADLIQACMISTLAKDLFAAYNNVPGEIQFIASHFASCQNIDTLHFRVVHTIPLQLPAIESAGQENVALEFPNAQIYQLAYPSIVPAPSDFPGDTCGGVERSDAKFIRSTVQLIDQTIRAQGAITAQTYPNFHVIDTQGALGANPLCPSDPTKALANGVNEAALANVVAQLVAPGSPSLPLIDAVSNDYQALRNCVISKWVFAVFCAPDASNLAQAVASLLSYFNQPEIMGLVDELGAASAPGQPPSPATTPAAQLANYAFDNSRFLFHPNGAGYQIMACNVVAAYGGGSPALCAPGVSSPLIYSFNGQTLTSTTPVAVAAGAAIPFTFNGFDPTTSVDVKVYSPGVDLGQVPVAATGTIAGSVSLPASLPPGVHQLEFTGTNGGTPRTVEVLVQIAGRPQGGADFGTYLCCFPADSQVDVNYGGIDWGVQSVDDSNGVFVDVPLPIPSTPGSVAITATGLTSATVMTQQVNPAPVAAAVWASGTGPGAITISGKSSAYGWVHSDGGVVLSGTGNALTGGVEYATTFTVSGSGNSVRPAAVRVSPGGEPLSVVVSTFQPGSPLAVGLGSSYHSISASACTGGTWAPTPKAIPTGVVYVPCAVLLSGTGVSATTTVIATGPITLTGTSWSLKPAYGGISLATSSTAANALAIPGSNLAIRGALWTAGSATVSGSSDQLGCGLYATTVTISGASLSLTACPPP